jgi:hypothetical protein
MPKGTRNAPAKPSLADYYRKQAVRCGELARTATNPEARKALCDIVTEYERLADQAAADEDPVS